MTSIGPLLLNPQFLHQSAYDILKHDIRIPGGACATQLLADIYLDPLMIGDFADRRHSCGCLSLKPAVSIKPFILPVLYCIAARLLIPRQPRGVQPTNEIPNTRLIKRGKIFKYIRK
jgi:hypothetical protein